MSFFEGGRKTINQTTTIQNRQVAIQGSGNVAISGGQLTAKNISFTTTDAGAVAGMRDVSVAAINASQRYAEFQAESNRLGLETVGEVAKASFSAAQTVASTGMSPEQIAADRGTVNKAVPIVLGIVAVVGLIIVAKKLK